MKESRAYGRPPPDALQDHHLPTYKKEGPSEEERAHRLHTVKISDNASRAFRSVIKTKQRDNDTRAQHVKLDNNQASPSVQTYLPLLATSLSKASCISERSTSVTIPNFQVASSSLCSCHGVAECGDPLVSLLIGIDVEKKSSWGAILLWTKRMLQNFKCLFIHCLVNQMFRSQVSTVVISTNSSHLDVAIDHEAL